jgi:hypothetical protein
MTTQSDGRTQEKFHGGMCVEKPKQLNVGLCFSRDKPRTGNLQKLKEIMI